MAGIYIHVPFCKQACFYCDFHFSTSLKKKDTLIKCLIEEIELRCHELENNVIETIYFGGGTPSLLTNKELRILIESIKKHYSVIENPEITLEANPDDLSENRIIELSESPINRLSIGIQSFFDDDLKSMNRAHNARESQVCLEYASKYFDNITIDLIYGIPDMSLEKWNKNLDKALSFGVNHISSYALTVEPKTALDTFVKKGIYPPIDEELALQHFNALVAKIETNGFVHYEISNFGKPGYFSKHNTSYWQGKSYLGIGPSAHSFYGNTRSWNVSNNTKYIQSIQKGKLPSTTELLSKQDQFNEYVMTGLRTIWGVSFKKIETDFGLDVLQHLKVSSLKFINQDLLELTNFLEEEHTSTLKVTKKGKFLVDGIASELFLI
ncbi:radical SAM family heme chaperone HemW [uncultured Algibacter sp.]|uniref:radical SAM family heme chaperone HemW n=1 Tax=uncultured Algibacter sp. TaxID=298659 RepID=UPI002619A397|nr:radical SAM family heme chaperone HemW [uncultured Algibacter sp.]